MLTNVLIMRHCCLLFLILIGLNACNNPKHADFPTKFNSEHWLLGSWTYLSGNDSIIEHWSYTDEELIGVNYRLKGSDSILNERMSIRFEEGEYIFEAKVENQNNGEGVPFTLKSYSENIFVVENKEHDFPQQIIYELINKDSCTASIAGKLNNEKRRIDFSLVRIPD